MSLDCDTKEGQKHIHRQNWIFKFIEKNGKDIRCIPTEDKTCGFDAFIYKDEILSSVVEIKNRPYLNRTNKQVATLSTLEKYGTYLITAQKLEVLKRASRQYCCKSYVVVNLPNDNPRRVLFFQITDYKGRYVIDFEKKVSRTFYSSNDYKGKIDRENAFIPLKNNKFLKILNY